MFVKEYLVDLNATAAAIRAGYSKNRASEIGSQQLRKTTVASAIQLELDKRAEKASITAQDVLESILRIRARAEEEGKHNDALKANELLGKHLKLFTDKVEHSGGIQLVKVHTGVKRD